MMFHGFYNLDHVGDIALTREATVKHLVMINMMI